VTLTVTAPETEGCRQKTELRTEPVPLPLATVPLVTDVM
jgi:hypothetical protein